MKKIQDNKLHKPKLMVVLAHPDDESFGMGGTIAVYAQKGVDITLICATRGEAGDVDEEYMEGYSSIADMRTAELQCAANTLGIKQIIFLGYRDSGMQNSPDNRHPRALVNADIDAVAMQIAHHIRRICPQVMLTFDPVGGYKHPDHIAIHRAAVRAFEMAASSDFDDKTPPWKVQKLYFHIMPKRMIKFMIRMQTMLRKDPRHFGRNKDIDLVSIIEDSNYPVHLRVNIRNVRKIKDAAGKCHASQIMDMDSRPNPIRWFLRLIGDYEEFMRYYPPAEDKLHETDLFQGVDFGVLPKATSAQS